MDSTEKELLEKRARLLHVAIEKVKKQGRSEIHFYTIPSGFKNNAELLEYWREQGYQAEIVDLPDGKHGVLHISW